MQLTSSMCLSIDASATFRISLSVLKIVTRASAVPATISLQQKRFKLASLCFPSREYYLPPSLYAT
jgi:hypothetical protein